MMTLVREEITEAGKIEHAAQASGAERRRGLRIAQNRPVKVYEPISSRFIPGQTHDVSATGLRIELPISAPVSAGKVLTIHVGLSGAGESLANRRQMIPARIVWIHRSDKASRTMTAGVEFLASISARRDAA